MCGEDVWEEVEVSVFVFEHVVVEFGFYCVGAVLFEVATCAMLCGESVVKK